MFTGIVEAIGTVRSITQKENLVILTISSPIISKGTQLGDSINVSGVCLTVAAKDKASSLTFELMLETIRSSNLSELKIGSPVNLERALKADSRFGGHFVTGHIDTMGQLQSIAQKKNFMEWTIKIEPKLLRFIVPKGSVTLDGVSLTVGKTNKSSFSVYLIPYTIKSTTLGQKRNGDALNIETDLLAKYVLTNRK